ncbi:GNAT family N-acetyltransferase [Ornithinimicrobium sp. Arc0846-15]|nr:GNAT family N-acetyltransferase [Ornithinimicrobium laminariae]
MTDKPAAKLAIRDATRDDAQACAQIYRPYVLETTITFELEPPSAPEFADRIANAQVKHLWLMAEANEGPEAGEIVGYAYAGTYRPRAAYGFTCETSVYLDMSAGGRGYGRELYAELLSRLGALGYRQAVAGMTMPNDASQRLHTSLGFEPIGIFRKVGYKFDDWRDVAWAQCELH